MLGKPVEFNFPQKAKEKTTSTSDDGPILTLDQSYEIVANLVEYFQQNDRYYLSQSYKEEEVRADFINKLLIALGWDVLHSYQRNPFEQEVKVEKNVSVSGSQRRADYAFYTKPNYRDPKFFVEAKKPFGDIATAQNYFQAIRYGWHEQTPIVVLTDFEQFQVLDCRYKPNIDSAIHRCIRKYHYTEYLDLNKYSEIWNLFSRDAVSGGSIEAFASALPKQKGRAVQKGLFKETYQSIDESFLEDLDRYRDVLARSFKNRNPDLDGSILTEITQRTLDRLVLFRFLEDKLILDERLVERLASSATPWHDFIGSTKALNSKYNGIVFKEHSVLDSPDFVPDNDIFSNICNELARDNSLYDFDKIPIHILGSIYERFLGKVIITTDKRAKVEDKAEVKKAGGVFYTPEYIVKYIVDNTVGQIVEGKSPEQISAMKFADIACGSGSFLLGVYDHLLTYQRDWYNSHIERAKKDGCVQRDDGAWHLSLNQRRKILVDNIFGVDIDQQAIEVTQLSLYLKLLEDVTVGSAKQHQLEFHETILPTLNKNIVCGNSIVGTDIDLTEAKRFNAMDFSQRFRSIMAGGGFDAIVGNPPYALVGKDQPILQRYYTGGNYKLTAYKINLYLLFLERALLLLKSNKGQLGYIIPKSLAFNTYFATARKRLLETYSLPLLVEIRDKVFVDAEVGDSLLIFAKSSTRACDTVLNYRVVENVYPKEVIVSDSRKKQSELLKNEKAYFIPQFVPSKGSSTCALSDKWEVENGLNPGNVRHILLSDSKVSTFHKKLVLGRDMQRYQLNWSGTWVNYNPELKSTIKVSDIKSKRGMTAQTKVDFALRSPAIYCRDKVLVRKTADHIVACYDDFGFYFDSLAYGIRAKPGTEESPLFLLGILNSKYIGIVHERMSQNKDKVFAKVLGENLKKLPIPKLNLSNSADIKQHDRVVALVESMVKTVRDLHVAKSDQDREYCVNRCEALQEQIDSLVDNLFK